MPAAVSWAVPLLEVPLPSCARTLGGREGVAPSHTLAGQHTSMAMPRNIAAASCMRLTSVNAAMPSPQLSALDKWGGGPCPLAPAAA